ncbi:MAG TPA: hypothetical protein VNJ04_17655, partial [Gemmatimonadaceae bacterium]|nr:hypothetical protein [Gemmatimonadaceae bacterium]
MAKVHHTFGSLEARAGHFERALRHFEMARRSLADSPNSYIAAAVALDESSTRSLMGDMEVGLSLAKEAAELAETSGWSKGVVASAANCAFFCVVMGRLRDAEGYLALAGRQRFSSSSYDFALSETHAQLLLAEGRLHEASVLLAEHCASSSGVAPWYVLSALDTQIRILNRQRRWKDAIRTADDALRAWSDSSARPVVASIQIRRALAVAGMGSRVSVCEIPLEEDRSDWPVSTVGNFWLARSCNSDPGSSLGHAKRSLRLYQAIGDRSSQRDAELVLSGLVGEEERQPTLDGAVALLELAAYPHILAREAFALLESTGCVASAALVARGGRTVRILETLGWDEQQATRAARKEVATGTIECGTYRDETLHIVADPPDDLERRCTFIAIKKLVATALTLDRYRRDEKQRAAL